MMVREVLFVDRSLYRALAVKYMIFTVMGLLAGFAFPPTLREETTSWAPFISLWCFGLGLAGLTALAGVLMARPGVEMFGGLGLIVTLSLYSAAFVVRSLDDGLGGRQLSWWVVTAASVALMVIPVWRTGDLWRRYRLERRARRVRIHAG